jgi:hypothetical protein
MIIIAFATFFMFRLASTVPYMLSSAVGFHSGVNTFSTGSFSSNFSSMVSTMTIAAAAMGSAAQSMRESSKSSDSNSSTSSSDIGGSGGGSFSPGFNESVIQTEQAAQSVEPTIAKNQDGSFSYSPVKPSEVKQDPFVAKEGLNKAREALRGGNAKS